MTACGYCISSTLVTDEQADISVKRLQMIFLCLLNQKIVILSLLYNKMFLQSICDFIYLILMCLNKQIIEKKVFRCGMIHFSLMIHSVS